MTCIFWKMGFFHKIFPQDFLQYFLQDFPQDFLARFFCKISHKIFLQDFPQNFPQDFPTRFSRKIFPQDFPQDSRARFSCKIFLQDFPAYFLPNFLSWILIVLLPITLFQMLNFCPSLPFLNLLFPLHPVLQDFPKISCKIFLHDLPAYFLPNFLSWILIVLLPITLFQMLNFCPSLPFLSWLFPLHAVLQDFLQVFPQKFSQDFPARFPTEFSTRFPTKFPKLDLDWLAAHHPIPNAKFLLMLNRPTYHKSAKVSPPPFPQILWEPQINE